MHLFLSLTGIILSAILLYFNARNNKSTIYLGIFFLLAGLYGTAHFFLFNSHSATVGAIVLTVSGFIPFLIGQSLYLYIRSTLNDNPSLQKRDAWHLLPLCLLPILLASYLFTPWSKKLEVAGKFQDYLNGANSLQALLQGNTLLIFTVFILAGIFYFGYVLWSAVMVLRFARQHKGRQISRFQQVTLRWIIAFIAIEILLVAGELVVMTKYFAFGDLGGYDTFSFLFNILGMGPIAILVMTFFSPGILYGLPRLPEEGEFSESVSFPEEASQSSEKSRSLYLAADYLQYIGQEADACMEQYRPFTNPGFSLAELSVLTHIPTHHLTYFFREGRNQSFTEYRTQWRVLHARNLIEEGMTSKMTLEAIGLLAGFTSRNTFHRAFKEMVGVTPGQLAEQLQK